ncbi:MAG: glycosyltransferase [Anaerolineales bacterium]|nr:glycosyltransferase [Anaerolineales bacterium]
MNTKIRILYDGWPLVHQPASHAALHLWELLHTLPNETEPVLALPAEAPAWFQPPAGLEVHSTPLQNRAGDRLRWEQRLLPRLANHLGVNLAHLTHNHPALLASVPTIISPGELPGGRGGPGLSRRLRAALGRGGMARAQGMLWPSDLPRPAVRTPAELLPPLVHPDFSQPGPPPPIDLDLPETFILYHGSYRADELRNLFDAWVWGAGALGDYYPMLLLGGRAAGLQLETVLERYDFGEAVISLPPAPPADMAAIYRRASALIHPGPEVPWGGAIRHGLASSLPIVTTDHPHNRAMVGAAAFTIPAGDTRKLGAGLITVIVEEAVSRKLAEAARRQASGWDQPAFRQMLMASYRRFRNPA